MKLPAMLVIGNATHALRSAGLSYEALLNAREDLIDLIGIATNVADWMDEGETRTALRKALNRVEGAK